MAIHYDALGDGARPPESVFLKLTPQALPQRLFLAVTGIGRNELRFYHSLRPSLPVRAPELHGSDQVASGRQFVLLLEDLVAAGARFANVGDRVDEPQARLVLAALARLHAGFWQSPRFQTDLAWVPSYERRRRDIPWERFVTGQMIGLALRRHAHDFPAEMLEVADVCRSQRDALELAWSRGPRTLVHGDCHVGNLYFDSAGVGFLDWQVCAFAPGMRDVSYFLCNSFPSKLRREHERDLVAFYLRELAATGTPAPGFDEAFRQHRLFALYTFIAAAFTAAAGGGLQVQEIGLAGLRRATAAAIELRSVECLREQHPG